MAMRYRFLLLILVVAGIYLLAAPFFGLPPELGNPKAAGLLLPLLGGFLLLPGVILALLWLSGKGRVLYSPGKTIQKSNH
jgi:hypothetical protein